MAFISSTDVSPAAGPDRRALWLSLGGGTLTGLLFVAPALWAAVTHTREDEALHAARSDLDQILGRVCLPLIVALCARRRAFLWAALAMMVHTFWTVSDRFVTQNWAGLRSDTVQNGGGDLFFLLLLAGPVSFVRWQVRLARDRAELASRAYSGPAEPEEGVWPPPPTRPPL